MGDNDPEMGFIGDRAGAWESMGGWEDLLFEEASNPQFEGS